jgi:hypothetical protein
MKAINQSSMARLLRRGWWVLLLLAGFLIGVVDPIVFKPERLRNEFIHVWSERLSSLDNSGTFPEDWKSVVCLRKFEGSNWVLAAMHHGSCSSSTAPFNCSVLRSSDGRTLVIPNWSPCSGSIEGMHDFWCAQIPATSIDELFNRTLALGERTH